MKKKYLMAILSILCFSYGLIWPRQGQAQEKDLSIVTSFYPVYAITQEIVGDCHQVQVINTFNGIHGFEPSANDIAAIYQADIFIYHAQNLESWTQHLDNNRGTSQVVMLEASKGIEFMKVKGLEDVEVIDGMDSSALFDPHSWLDPLQVAVEAQIIADYLSEVDPANEATYQANAKAFVDKAQGLVDKYQEIFNQSKQKTFVTQHTAFSYLAQRFGLEQLGISGISSDIEPTSKKLAEIQTFVKEKGLKKIFVEPNVSDKAAQVISKATGAEIVELSPLESDPHNSLSFLENLDNTLATLSQNLLEEE